MARYESDFEWGGLPLLAIACGADPAKGEVRGHAKGIVAIGDKVIRVVAAGRRNPDV